MSAGRRPLFPPSRARNGKCDHVVVTPVLRLGDYETCVPGELGLLHCEDFRDDAH